jgi:hypothetical protein
MYLFTKRKEYFEHSMYNVHIQVSLVDVLFTTEGGRRAETRWKDGD